MRTLLLTFNCILLVTIGSINARSQVSTSDFESWPNKDAVIKTKLIFPDDLYNKYKMQYLKGTTSKSLVIRFQYIINETSYHNGALRIYLYESAKLAQLNMYQFIENIVVPIPRVINASFKMGDVVYETERDSTILRALTCNNVFIWMRAPSKIANELTQSLIKIINESPEWIYKEEPPSFVFDSKSL